MQDPHIESEFAAIRREIAALENLMGLGLADVRREMGQHGQNWQGTISALQRAVDKAEEEMKQKLGIMNEFRSALSDQATKFVQREQFEDLRTRVEAAATRAELDSTLRTRETRFTAAESRLATLEQWQSNIQGRMWGIPMVVGLVVFIVTQLMRVLFPAQ
jgi:hypothetical protein